MKLARNSRRTLLCALALTLAGASGAQARDLHGQHAHGSQAQRLHR